MAALILYTLTGLCLGLRFLPGLRLQVRCWVGLVFGAVLLMWLPCLTAFLWGFTMTGQTAALVLALLTLLALGLEALLRCRGRGITPARLRALAHPPAPGRADAAGLLLAALATALCAVLLYTHVLRPGEDGGLWVGQSTFGDLAMHLGFAESLYQQGTFPPEYSIYPGQLLNYPFLVDAASASLRFFGLSLRWSFILPSLLMLFCVFWGFWLLADKLTAGRVGSNLLAWLLFVFNGGFGFVYFLGGKYEFSGIFTGYYTTPTNLVDGDIRWVNIICDMLIPQRTTMAGWCVVLAALYLLLTVLERLTAGRGCRAELLSLALLAGALPMIHTHSFLALGILSAAWFFVALPRAARGGRVRGLVRGYVVYGVICLILAAPQLLKWTMGSVRTGNLLQWNLGWVVGQNGALTNWLWFYVVNLGVVFLGLIPALFLLKDIRRGLLIGTLAVFVLANLIAFQPNLYDNNKLLYIWFMVTDILVCDALWERICRLRSPAVRAALAGAIALLGTFSGFLSILREAVSSYRLFDAGQVAAAEFITENTAPDSLFLTSDYHANPVCVLAGRNIVCGSSLYLFFHGVDYQERAARLPVLYAGGDEFPDAAAELGIDYVYIGDAEYGKYDVNESWFRENYPIIYDDGGITIFQITG